MVTTIIEKSLNYTGEYIHPRSANIDTLYETLTSALERLNSIEEEHEIHHSWQFSLFFVIITFNWVTIK